VTGESQFGTILFDDTGQAVYVFDVETTAEPRCYGDCAEAWPPVLSGGAPRGGRGVEAARLGTTRRSDGSTQVTYAGRPLYFYAHEGKHEVECHDVFLNGGTWYAMQPDGQPPA
jgi:predicted lipoprotein with Yx(FWY)xxD motif